MRFAVPIAIVCLAATLLAGCGGSSGSGTGGSAIGGATESTAGGQASESSSGAGAPAGASAQVCPTDVAAIAGLRVTAVSCGEGQKVVLAWSHGASCTPAAGASQAGCSVRGYRCLATVTDRGLSVSCARPGRSIAFTAKD